jgi:flagella basal body P-ring formation protein FlgA
MKCSKLLQISVLNLFLLWVSFSLTFTRSELLKLAKEQIKAINPSLVVEGLTLYTEKVEIPDEPYTVQIAGSKGRYFLVLKELSTGKTLLQIPLKVAIVKTVVVAKRDIKPGEVIDKSTITLVRKKFFIVPKDVFSDGKQVIGKRAKTYIPKGGIIKTYQVETSEGVVKCCTPVKVIFKNGNLEVETEGKTLERAKIGETVRVKVGKKIFYGRLKNENTVVVNF